MTPIERLCPSCDEPFLVRADNPDQRFCSRRCAVLESLALPRCGTGEIGQEGAGMNVRQSRLADAIASLGSAATLIVPGYHVTVDAIVFELMIRKALAELAKSGRRVDFESLSQYMTMRHVLRECVTIEVVAE